MHSEFFILRYMKKRIIFSLFFGCAASLLAQQRDTSETKPPVQLNEIIISASQVRDDAPVTLTTLRRKEISDYLSTKTYPEIMRNIGGVYATPESGSYGDAKVNIRGFKQENVTVLLNGVPLSGFRSGSMFWNNWLGLTDATYRVQVQKGIGSSMLAANSVGGTINIITNPTAPNAAGEALFTATDYGQFKLGVSLSSGMLKNGWGMSFVGSHTWGNGYVDATDVKSWAYFLNVSKTINKRHSLLFTLLGSPEKHGQRSQKLSADEVDKHGLKYNKNWGYYKDEVNNVSGNFYHKPYMALNHFFNISDRAFWSNTVYFSIGNGGGKWTESTGKKITSYINADGQIDWDTVVADNVNDADSVRLPDGSYAAGYSKNIQSDYLAGHTTAGFKSSLDWQFDNHWKLSAGLYYQYFYSWQEERITDLLGGRFWYEDYENNSLAGLAGRNPVKEVGDYIRLNNGDRDNLFSTYAQVDYAGEKFSAFVGGMLMFNNYQHWDKYNYIDNPYSDRVWAVGGNIKAGGSFKLSRRQQVYANAAYYSRTPYDNVYFASGTNEITSDVNNEKNYMAEAGYKFSGKSAQLNVNAYYTYWKNKSLLSDPYKPLEDEQVRYMINGLDAQHVGVELNYDQRIARWLNVTAFASLGNWEWKNDVNATIYDPYTGLPVDTLRVFADGLLVGDAPQTQVGLVATARVANALVVRAECRYNDRMYANFDPARRTNAADRSQSYRIPSSFVTDFHIDYSFHLFGAYANLFFACNNVFNATYIERGDDGVTHDLASFRGFWGVGRSVQVGVRVKL